MNKILIVTDIQNDFCPGGSLAVPDGDKIIPFVNYLILSQVYDFIVYTQDWHPSNHKSFASQNEGSSVFEKIIIDGIEQVLWPDHCIQNTYGAEFHKSLITDVPSKFIFQKGSNVNVDSYSAFYDNKHNLSTGLGEFLSDKHIEKIDIVGLALDFCVKFTAIDANRLGFETSVLLAGCKSISKDINSHLNEMKRYGIKIH